MLRFTCAPVVSRVGLLELSFREVHQAGRLRVQPDRSDNDRQRPEEARVDAELASRPRRRFVFLFASRQPTSVQSHSSCRCVVRDHFNCQTLVGAELEDFSENGDVGSHWEERVFGSEIMTP